MHEVGVSAPDTLLSADSITKSFDAIHALKGVSFDVRSGEVHGLVGENGAGKSTLIKIMSGDEAPDGGTLKVRRHVLTRFDPVSAHAFGIAVVHQQPSLFPQLSVAENLALGVERPRPWRPVDWKARRRRAQEMLSRVCASIDADRRVDTLTMPEQQLVEIARALGAEAKVLILDEPTASLTAPEVDALLDVIRRLREQGTGIVYISHRLDEVLAVADRITVLRDGRAIATRAARDLSSPELVRLMVGNELNDPPTRATALRPEVACEVRHLSSRAAGMVDLSFSVGRGEILGLAGLVGSGRTQLAETIFGITPSDRGDILIGGKPVRVREPRDAIRAGIGYVPEDRRRHGVIVEMSIAANSTLACLETVSRNGLIDRAAERAAALRFITRLDIKPATPLMDVTSLSGGNQQKVAVARWLATSPSVLILDEPTQGVDVRSKGEIHRIIRELADSGIAVILISSELPEILAMSDRIAVMRGGGIAGILSRAAASPQAVLSLALGTDTDAEKQDVEA